MTISVTMDVELSTILRSFQCGDAPCTCLGPKCSGNETVAHRKNVLRMEELIPLGIVVVPEAPFRLLRLRGPVPYCFFGVETAISCMHYSNGDYTPHYHRPVIVEIMNVHPRGCSGGSRLQSIECE